MYSHHFRVSCSDTQFGIQGWKEGQYHDEGKYRCKKYRKLRRGRRRSSRRRNWNFMMTTRDLANTNVVVSVWVQRVCSTFNMQKMALRSWKNCYIWDTQTLEDCVTENIITDPAFHSLLMMSIGLHRRVKMSKELRFCLRPDKYETWNVYFIILCFVCSKYFSFQ